MSAGNPGGASASAAAAAAAGQGETDPDKLIREMHAMLMGLTANVSEVREDIEGVKKDLGEQIDSGRRETESLKRRMDDQDQGFEDRVAGVIHKLGILPGPPPSDHFGGLLSTGASGPASGSYAAAAGQFLPPSSSSSTVSSGLDPSSLSLIHI